MSNGLQVDESLLTGEAAPVRRRRAMASRPRPPGGDDCRGLFRHAGGAGQGVARVTAPGRAPRSAGSANRCRRCVPSPVRCSAGAPHDVGVCAAGRRLCGVVVVLYASPATPGSKPCSPHHPRHLPAAAGVSGGAHGFPCTRGLAYLRSRVLTRRIPALETLGAAPSCARTRPHHHREPHDVTQLVTRDACYAVDYAHANTLPKPFTSWSNSACWPAWSTLSTDGESLSPPR